MSGLRALILILIVTAVKCEDLCEDVYAHGCSDTGLGEGMSSLEGLPDAEFLDTYCSPFIKNFNCENNYMEKCGYPEYVTPALVQRVSDLVESVCDPASDLRKGYLANVDCYNTALPEIFTCAMRTAVALRGFLDANENRTELRRPVVETCLGIPLTKDCMIKMVSEECGEDQADPLDEIMDTFASIATDMYCPQDLYSIWKEELATYMMEEERKKRRK